MWTKQGTGEYCRTGRFTVCRRLDNTTEMGDSQSTGGWSLLQKWAIHSLQEAGEYHRNRRFTVCRRLENTTEMGDSRSVAIITK
jgi:hypothetical protein